jgi:hypothetical protein
MLNVGEIENRSLSYWGQALAKFWPQASGYRYPMNPRGPGVLIPNTLDLIRPILNEVNFQKQGQMQITYKRIATKYNKKDVSGFSKC